MFIFIILLSIQIPLFLFFLFFAFYNYRYQIAGFFRPKLKKVLPSSNAKVAIVIVCHNEKLVISDTIHTCEQLTYQNKTIIVGDDSDDLETTVVLKAIADRYGCQSLNNKEILDSLNYLGVTEAYESEGFILLHREKNTGFKAGNLKVIETYLKANGFEYMYLLDADWRPEPKAVEKCLAVIEADPDIAYVQTRRNSYYGPSEHFQRCIGIMEEACYYVDLVGRQVSGDMILFSGCCAMFRLSHLYEVGGFIPGHLTEDIDLSNRCYLAGFKGVYLHDVQNVGEVPPDYKSYRKQQDRWAKGSVKVLRDYFTALIKSRKLDLITKLSIIRQNAYFTIAVGTDLSIISAVISLFLLFFCWSFGAIAHFNHLIRNVFLIIPFTYLIFFSSIFHLIILVFKKKEWLSLFYIPLVWWLNLSIIHTYFIANLIRLKQGNNSWFLTPKTNRVRKKVNLKSDWGIKIFNLASLVFMVVIYYLAYITLEGTAALIIPYAISWIPAFIIGAIKS